MIKIRDIKKSFFSNKVLDGISFDIKAGDVVAIIGPSGTGKSTLLRCINSITKPDGGVIEFDDFKFDTKDHRKKDLIELRKKTSMVFQQFNLFSKKTVLKNVMEGLTVVQKIPKKEAKEIAIKELTKVHMDDRQQYYPKHLSGGQQQRVAIARALANSPKILLSDEATSALDPDATESILKLLKKLNKELGLTIIIITHEMAVIREIADRAAVMENGRIVEEGEVYDIFSTPQQPITRRFVETSSSLGNIGKLVENHTVSLENTPRKKLIKLTFTRDSVGEALISSVSRKFDVDLSIVLANVNLIGTDALGGIIATLEGDPDHVSQALDYIQKSGVRVEVIDHA